MNWKLHVSSGDKDTGVKGYWSFQQEKQHWRTESGKHLTSHSANFSQSIHVHSDRVSQSVNVWVNIHHERLLPEFSNSFGTPV